MPEARPRPVLAGLHGPLRAIGGSVLPSGRTLGEEGWRQAQHIIEHALEARPAGVRRQFRLFLRVVSLLPFLWTGRTLQQLPPRRRAAFLDRLQRSRLLLLRRGFWGVRTLLFMGYYLQEPIRTGIGYRARGEGWAGRGETNMERAP